MNTQNNEVTNNTPVINTLKWDNTDVANILKSFSHKSAGTSEMADLMRLETTPDGQITFIYPDMQVQFVDGAHAVSWLIAMSHRALSKMSMEDRENTSTYCSTGPWLSLKHKPENAEISQPDLVEKFGLEDVCSELVKYKNTIIARPLGGVTLINLKDALAAKGFAITGLFLDEETLSVSGLKVKLPELEVK